MNAEKISARESLQLIRRGVGYLKPLRARLAVKIGLSILGLASALILPWPLKVLIDHVIMGLPIGESATPYPPFFQPFLYLIEDATKVEVVLAVTLLSAFLILVMGAFGTSGMERDRTVADLSQGEDTATQSENQANMSGSLVSGLLGIFEYRWQLKITHDLNHRFRADLFAKLLRLPMARYQDSSIGDAVYRVMYDTPAISRICYDIWLVPIVSIGNVGLVIWTMTYSFSAVPEVIWAAWIVTPLVFIAALFMTSAARSRSISSREAGSVTTATLEEGMNNVIAVQSLGGTARETEHFESDSEHSYLRYRRLRAVALVMSWSQYFILVAAGTYVYLILMEAIITGVYTAGDFGVLLAYYFQLVGSTSALGRLWFNLQDNVAGMKRIFQIIDLPEEQESDAVDTGLDAAEALSFQGVSLTYPDGTEALKDISLEVKQGEMIALVGATGSGKTSLSYLIPRYLSPTAGEVCLNGTSLERIGVADIRRNVAFVFQEPAIFDDSVEGNIRLGNPNASSEEIERAATIAGAMEFIGDLPDGMHTRLGRGGGKLSVGQKQRIAIARGLVSTAPVLILDEPTSALDPETERALVNSLNSERERRILVVIAHRLSTVRHADRIYFLDNGRIVESGSHQALMEEKDGPYRRFVELQTGSVDEVIG